MAKETGGYQDVYIKRRGEFISLKNDVTAFCETWIKKVHSRNWDWSIRDFENPKNDPTVEEARVIRNIVYRDIKKKLLTEVDLSTINNAAAILAFLDPKSKYEVFNMEEFAYALKVELEHGRVKDVNVTNNHPFLTAMIVLAHISESISYYKRLKVMETEAEIYELTRKIAATRKNKDKLFKDLLKAEHDLLDARKALSERLEKMDEIPVLEKIGD
jgi:hypothetical protein